MTQQQNSSDSPNTADIVERLEGPVPTLNENGIASLDFGENYRERKEAAAIIMELRQQRLMILTAVYGEAPRFVATICDEKLDRTGALLGQVRELARAALKDHRKAQA